MEKETLNYKTLFNKCKKIYKKDKSKEGQVEGYKDVVVAIDQFIADIKSFEVQQPLATLLRVEGMQDRHWDQLSKKSGKHIPFNDRNFNLSAVIKLNLHDHLEVIEELSTRAAKEWTIRRELDKMQRDWKSLDQQFTLLKNTTDVYIIKNFEDCLNINDEYIGIATNLQQSPYKFHFEDEIYK